jgi:hypothetical protein
MARKLMGLLTLVAVTFVVAGCKDDGPTPMKFDPKDAYKNQGTYTKGEGTSATTSTATGTNK